LDEARRTGTPFVRPLVLEYQDDSETYAMDDQFLAGRDLLCSPVVRPDQDEKRVYLPRGNWYDFYTGAPQKKRHQLVEAPLETVPLYARGGSVIPLGPEKNTVDALPNAPLELRVYPDTQGQAESTLYEDDGKTQAYLNGQCARRKVSFRNRQLTIEATSYALPQRSLQLRFYATRAKLAIYNGKPLPVSQHSNYVEVQIPESGQAHSLKLI
jgi:alpha-glucosidase